MKRTIAVMIAVLALAGCGSAAATPTHHHPELSAGQSYNAGIVVGRDVVTSNGGPQTDAQVELYCKSEESSFLPPGGISSRWLAGCQAGGEAASSDASPAPSAAPSSSPVTVTAPHHHRHLTPGQKFAAAVEAASTTYESYSEMGAWSSEASLAHLGRAICNALETGNPISAVEAELEGGANFNDLGVSASQMVAIAQVQICPSTL